MSRSFRAAWYVDGYKSRGGKRKEKNFANRKVRHTAEIANGKAYRKVYDPWNIVDYRFPYTKEPIIWWYNGEPKLIEPQPIWRVNRK